MKMPDAVSQDIAMMDRYMAGDMQESLDRACYDKDFADLLTIADEVYCEANGIMVSEAEVLDALIFIKSIT